MRYEIVDLGNGPRRHSVYDMPVIDPLNYWSSVTDVPCPLCKAGTIRWHEAGYAPGSRLCDGCGRFFQAKGSVRDGITLVRDSRFDESVSAGAQKGSAKEAASRSVGGRRIVSSG